MAVQRADTVEGLPKAEGLFEWFCDPSLDLVYDCKGKKNIWTGKKNFSLTCLNGGRAGDFVQRLLPK